VIAVEQRKNRHNCQTSVKSEFSVSTEIGDAMLCSDRMLMFVRNNVTVQISAFNVKDHMILAKELDSKILG